MFTKISMVIGIWIVLIAFITACFISETFLLVATGLVGFSTLTACIWMLVDSIMNTCKNDWK